MKNSDKPANEAPAEHTVTSRSSRGKTLSFTMPTWQPVKPHLPANERVRSGLLALAFVAVAVLGGLFGGYIESHNASSGVASGSLSGQKKIVTSQSQLISQIAKSVGPSVVSVNSSITDTSSPDSLSPFGLAQPQQSAEAAGTGIIISSSGLIVTNRHVVPDGTTKVSVILSDGTELKDVKVLGRTTSSDTLDIAFLKITDAKGHKLTPAAIGDSSNVLVGDDVVAIGNALGQFQNTVTSGIISGFGRSVQASSDGGSASFSSDTESLDNLFQTDAAINEGNSGGPLTNLNGQVIGINTAIAGDAQNIGFAIPINDVKGLIDQVLKTGKFERPYLGVHYLPLTADVADQYDLALTNGAFIVPTTDASAPSVVSGSPADQAGLQDKDIITAVGDTKIDQTHSLTSLLNQHEPGDHVTLTITRNGKSLRVDVQLGTLPTN